MAKVILATASYDHTIRFWEAPTSMPTRTIQYPDSQVNRIAITPDKCLLAAAGNPHVRFFDINSNNQSAVRLSFPMLSLLIANHLVPHVLTYRLAPPLFDENRHR